MRAIKLLLVASTIIAITGATAQPTKPGITVMSFNLRYSAAKDGDNGWEHRKEFVRDVIKSADPDLLGTQEGLSDQLRYLREQLPDYHFVGVGREDGKEKSEFCAVFIKKASFDVADSGHYWLSETPKVAGSKSWDSSLPRMATWVRVIRRDKPAETLYFVNTHWDHRGTQARLESAKLMRKWAGDIVKDQPLIVTGDMNCYPDSEPMKHLIASAPAWTDSFRAKYPTIGKDEASFHGFKGTTAGSRIDFILHTPHLATTDAAIDRTQRAGKYPSDHYPVTARLAWVKP